MTLVVCPNLAIDRMIAAAAIVPGGLMRCRALRTQAGGKGANVLRALRALGGGGVLAGFAAGRGGRLIAELADDEGLDLELVVTDGEARVSTVVLEDDGSVTRLYELGPQIGADDERALLDLVGGRAAGAGDWAVVSGAAPPGASPGFYAALVRDARDAGYRVLLDATGEQLAGALAERPELVKVNLAEACSAVGDPSARCRDDGTGAPEDLAAEGVELSRRLVAAGAVSAIVTLGAAGAVGVIAAEVWHVHTRPVAAVNPVGSGDCFAAGLILASGRGEDTGAALRLAAGAAAANATSPYNGHVDPAFARALTDDAHAVRHAM
ncbi:MAG TPA: PfkB family carbohydrate kinase [Thermoleophilia bacterium]|nr:PfkB family carbohydrate kinase [Thermoleophilia bacterium]